MTVFFSRQVEDHPPVPARRPPGPPPPRPISPPHGTRAHMALHAMSDSDDEDDPDDPDDPDYEPQWDDPTWDIGVEDEKMDEEEPAQDDPPYNPEDDDPADDPPYNPEDDDSADDPPYNPEDDDPADDPPYNPEDDDHADYPPYNPEDDDPADDPDDPPYNPDQTKENWAFIKAQKADSTVRKTDRDIMRFRQFLAAGNHPEAFETLSAATLDALIATFIRGLQKKDGGEYEPGTITGVHCSFDRILREAEYEINIMHSPLFKSSREMVEAKRRFLKSCGKGNGPDKAVALTEEEVEKIWSGGGFGNTDPDGLVSAMWFLLALNFGLRGCHECRQLTVGDLSVKQHVSEQSYLEMVERTTKTRCGAGRGHGSGQRAFTPKAWSNGTSRCPVYYHHEYTRRRPDKMTDPSSPFFLNVNRQKKANNPIWFACKPMGKNLLSGMLKRAANHVGIDRPGLTNHAVRKTSIQRLFDARIDPIIVAQHTGHKDPSSLRHYMTANLDTQRLMGRVLAQPDLVAEGLVSAHI